MILHTYIERQRKRTALAKQVQARYRRKTVLARQMNDPDTVICIIGFAFVGGVCLACLIGFLMPV